MKMLCSNCKKRHASVFWEQTTNGETHKISLCAECAAQTTKNAVITSEFDEGIFMNMFGLAYVDPGSSAICPLCKSGLREIIRSGRVGCAKCYETFAPELKNALRAIHRSCLHTGRTPKKYSESKEREYRLTLLRAELKHAIEHENFERCGVIRDEIRELEKSVRETAEKAGSATTCDGEAEKTEKSRKNSRIEKTVKEATANGMV